MPNNQIRSIYQDKKGYIWFATNEGLSRFDGYFFTNYDDRDGLGDIRINDVAEDVNGRFWVANNGGGISLKINRSSDLRADRISNQKFKTYIVGKTETSNRVNRILIDSDNFIWCLTDGGLFRAAVSDDPKFELIYAYKSPIEYKSRLLFQGSDGHIWFAVEKEIFEVFVGRVISHGEIPYEKKFGIANGFQDKKGRLIFIANDEGPFEFIRPNGEGQKPQWRKLMSDLQNTINFRFIMRDDLERIWFAGWGGFFKFTDENLQNVEKHDFGGLDAISMIQDREGNLWIGGSTGVRRISDESLISFDEIGDVESPQIKWLQEDNGTIRLGFIDIRQTYIEKFRKAQFSGNQLEPGEFDNLVSSYNGNYSLYRQPNIWKDGVDFPVARPVFRLSSGKEIDGEKYLEKPLADEGYMSFYEDEKGSLWIIRNDEFLHRADPNEFPVIKTEKFPCDISGNDGNSRMMTDHNGGIWLFTSVFKRFRHNRCEIFEANQQLTDARPRSGFYDSRGWFWIATDNGGVAVTENQSADQPIFRFYSENDGLMSRTVKSIIEDKQGRMYFGTTRGLSRFTSQNGQWESFTSKSGLPSNEINSLYLDSAENIWILTLSGLAKLIPKFERKRDVPPPIYISRVNIAGEDLPLPEDGFAENQIIELDAADNNLTIDFVGLQFRGEDSLRYQYILEGTDKEWNKPNKNRTITFANLGSGNYRFMVRAVNQNGLTSPQPAVFQFKVYPPIYLRWWFMAIAVLVISTIIYAFYRARLQKLLEVERTRAIIATDLHDDIGSNLSKISVLSEVVRLQFENQGGSDSNLLSSIAEISRESVGSMSDIVWAINPKSDTVLEMIRKMRQHAEETFVPKGISVEITVPEKGSKIKLPMDLRRDLYLAFKESVNNIGKHSECTKVKIDFTVTSHEIILQIEDNGKGFDLTEQKNGNGLPNIQKRIERLGGIFQIESEKDHGTKIIIRIPQY